MLDARNRVTNVLLALVLLALISLIAMYATGVRGGPLDPSESPGSTMKSLDEIPGSWSRRLNAANGSAGPLPPAGCNSDRFRCVLTTGTFPAIQYNAVLDLETGLVWERSPSDTAYTHGVARDTCRTKIAGQRRGWRLPTIEELSTLLDGAGGLPSGHPFTINNESYWTLALSQADSSGAIMINPVTGSVNGGPLTVPHVAWCVRGGYASDTPHDQP